MIIKVNSNLYRQLYQKLNKCPLTYKDFLWALNQQFNLEVYIDDLIVPENIMFITELLNGESFVEIASSNNKWLELALNHININKPVEWMLHNKKTTTIVNEKWSVKWNYYHDLVCLELPKLIETRFSIRQLTIENLDELFNTLKKDSQVPKFQLWRSPEMLQDENSLAYGAFFNNQLVAWIIASPFVEHIWDVDFIYTVKNWRNQGLATILTNRYAKNILIKKQIPTYCSPQNIASQRAAEKGGFSIFKTRAYSE